MTMSGLTLVSFLNCATTILPILGITSRHTNKATRNIAIAYQPVDNGRPARNPLGFSGEQAGRILMFCCGQKDNAKGCQ